MRALFLTTDLMFSSSVYGAAQRVNRELQIVSTCEALQQQAAKQDAGLVILDLSFAGIDLATLVSQLREALADRAKIIAYGPHVNTAMLAAAQEAGCDEVLVRGEFNNQMDRLLVSYLP